MAGPDWEFELPDEAPWPHQVAGLTTPPLCRFSSDLQASSGGAQPPTLQAPLLSSWSTVMTKGTTPTMVYWKPLARIVEWPKEDGNDVRAM